MSVPAALKRIPPFPPIAARVLTLLADPSVQVAELAELIRSDSTFTARVLQHANSAAFSFPSPIEDVDHAITMMGLDRTRELVVLYGAGAYATRALRTAEMRSCWQHSIATAVIAEQIAKSSDLSAATAFTAGIMHDIGRLGLLTAYPKEYELIIRTSVERCIDLLDFERERFGVHHAEAGLYLAQQWGLPSEFHIIAGRHHDPCEGFDIDLLKIVHVACRCAQVLGYDLIRPLLPLHLDDVLAELPSSARAHMDASAEQLSVQVERAILEFDSEEPDSEHEPDSREDAVATAIEQPAYVECEPIEPPQLQSQPAVVSWPATIAVLLILVAFLLWQLTQLR